MEPDYIKRERIKLTNIKIDNKRSEKTKTGKMNHVKVKTIDPSLYNHLLAHFSPQSPK